MKLTVVKGALYKGIVDKKGAIEIPKAIRDQIGIKPGSTIAFEVDGQNIVMLLVPGFPPETTSIPKEKAPKAKEKPPKGKGKPTEETDEIAKQLAQIADEDSKKTNI